MVGTRSKISLSSQQLVTYSAEYMIKLFSKSFFLTLFCLLVCQQARAEVVKYTDSKSNTFFVDSVDKIPAEYKGRVQKLSKTSKVSRVKTDNKKLYEKSHYPTTSNAPKKLEIFIADWCGYCRALEADLKKAGIPYEKYNIETSKIGQKVYKELGGGGIPISRINGKTIIRGYSSLNRIKQALAAD